MYHLTDFYKYIYCKMPVWCCHFLCTFNVRKSRSKEKKSNFHFHVLQLTKIRYVTLLLKNSQISRFLAIIFQCQSSPLHCLQIISKMYIAQCIKEETFVSSFLSVVGKVFSVKTFILLQSNREDSKSEEQIFLFVISMC